MGGKWEVRYWVPVTDDNSQYENISVYLGHSLIKALLVMRAGKKANVGCISLLWRP